MSGAASSATDFATELTVPKTPVVIWSNVAELKAQVGIPSLLKPRVRNQAGLDTLAWITSDKHHAVLDTTVSRRHGVHVEGVSAAVRALGWTPSAGWKVTGSPVPNTIKYLWILPEDRYDRWGHQSPKPGSTATPEAQEVWAHMVQYAVCVTSQVKMQQVAKVLEQQGVQLPNELLG